MPGIKYRVSLTEEEKEMLEFLLRKGKSAARRQTRARILLKAAVGSQDAEIMEALAASATMVFNTRQKCVEEGVEAALEDRPRSGATPKLSESQCAHLIVLACTPAPEGHDHWTLRLLADQVVQSGYAESFNYEGIRRLFDRDMCYISMPDRFYGVVPLAVSSDGNTLISRLFIFDLARLG